MLATMLAVLLPIYGPNPCRARLRKFPSLVNCCTIDWFSEWPSDALRSVASQFLKVCAAKSDPWVAHNMRATKAQIMQLIHHGSLLRLVSLCALRQSGAMCKPHWESCECQSPSLSADVVLCFHACLLVEMP